MYTHIHTYIYIHTANKTKIIWFMIHIIYFIQMYVRIISRLLCPTSVEYLPVLIPLHTWLMSRFLFCFLYVQLCSRCALDILCFSQPKCPIGFRYVPLFPAFFGPKPQGAAWPKQRVVRTLALPREQRSSNPSRRRRWPGLGKGYVGHRWV